MSGPGWEDPDITEEAGEAETPTIADPLAVRLLESCSNRVALYLKIKLLLKLT